MSSPPKGAFPAIFLLSMATLAIEVALVRVLSVALWYHFAFLVVSVAVLGFGLSGMVLALRPSLLAGDVAARLQRFATMLGLAVALCLCVIVTVPFEPFVLGADPLQMLYGIVYCLALTLPFFLSGMCIGILLTAFPEHAGRLYGTDLLGAGLGAISVTFAFAPLGGSGTVMVAAALASAAAVAFAQGARARLFAGAVTLGLALFALFAEAWLPVRGAAGKALHSEWNALSRIDVVEDRGLRRILIDGGVAMVRLPRMTKPIAELRPPRDAATVPLDLHQAPRVLILGSGGGWEVVGALRMGALAVTAVELNPAINRLVTETMADYVGHVFADPRITLVTDEARSFLHRSAERWDVIVSAHTISNAATATGALSLAESYTLTREAFDDYLDHLAPGGHLCITRPEPQIPKLVATAAAALRAAGLEPATHLATFRHHSAPGVPSFSAGLLLSVAPIDEAALHEALARREFIAMELPALLLGPESPTDPATEPATDDRPFFNRRRSWRSIALADIALLFEEGRSARWALEERPIAEASLALLLVIAIFIAGLCTFVPLVWHRRRLRLTARAFALLGYFALLGAGFMFAELGLVHRLTLFVGPPTLTFAVVIGAILLSSGLGARLAGRLSRSPARVLIACALVVGLTAVLAPTVTDLCHGASLPIRAAIAAFVVAPTGFLIGMPFPLGLRVCRRHAPELLPIAWALNGFASVLGSVACLMWATAYGFSSVLVTAAVLYLAAALACTAGQVE